MNVYKANVIDIYELTNAINLQYGENWDALDIATLMFGNDYRDNVYYPYDYSEDSVEPTLNLINGYLRDVLDLSISLVLIHVYW